MAIDGECEHCFVYGGIKFEIGLESLPGTGAKLIRYYDWLYCQRCGASRYTPLINEHDSYQPIRYNATPMERSCARS